MWRQRVCFKLRPQHLTLATRVVELRVVVFSGERFFGEVVRLVEDAQRFGVVAVMRVVLENGTLAVALFVWKYPTVPQEKLSTTFKLFTNVLQGTVRNMSSKPENWLESSLMKTKVSAPLLLLLTKWGPVPPQYVPTKCWSVMAIGRWKFRYMINTAIVF